MKLGWAVAIGGVGVVTLTAIWYEMGPQSRQRYDAEVRTCVQRVRLRTASVERARVAIGRCLTERYGWAERRATGEVALLEVVAPGAACPDSLPGPAARCVELVQPLRESLEHAVGN